MNRIFRLVLFLLFLSTLSCLRRDEELAPPKEEVAPSILLADSLETAPQSEQHYKTGQTIYAPVYSEIYFMDDKKKILLGATLSIHNVDPDSNLVLTKVDYYDSKGKLLTHHLKKPGLLKPLQTQDFVVELTEKEGGTGANFLVEWRSAHQVVEPLVETIMISASSSRGVSFVSRGKVVRTFAR